MMHFTVEEENLICMYHNADRRRTIGKITAAMPGMDGDMWTLICPLSSRQVKYLKVSDKNTYISFWSVGIFMHTISLYIF